MATNPLHFLIPFMTFALLSAQPVLAQNKISGLDDYTGEMLIGSDTYQYNFTEVEGNECKFKLEELLTDKKGSSESRSWIFYLSDIDPSAISFKAKGKSIVISMETYRSQKFISYFEDGELDAYTEKISVSMNEVDLARSFIENIKEKIGNCKESQASWENRDQAFTWLKNNVQKATNAGIEWDQKFESGTRSYLVDFQSNSVNEKGIEELSGYTFDLSDINSQAINLRISGKSLIVEVPVKESKRFIQVKSPAGTEYTNEIQIQANDIESARQIVNALTFVVTNTTPERPQWDSYNASLGFVKDNLGEVKIGDEKFSNSLSFNASPSGLIEMVINKTESDGSSEGMKYLFYLADLAENLKLEVSKSSISIKMETKNKREYIREIKDDKTTDYDATLVFHSSDIDNARDIVNAFEHAIHSSEENIIEFSNINEIGSWFSEYIGTIEIDGDQYEQNLIIVEEYENQLILEKKLTESDEGSTETRFILYPEDIGLDNLEIKVSGKKLSVPLVSDRYKYIKNYKDGLLQNFTGSVEILFDDPSEARNFAAAIRFLKENPVVEDRTIEKDEAIKFLSDNIQSIKISDVQYDQKVEFKDEENCKVSFTLVETDNKGASDEYVYEFNMSDIHAGNSKFSIKRESIIINLVTSGNEKLIKPFKNGEPDDFIDDFFIYVDDILIAKKTLAAFTSISEGCK